MFKFLFKGIKEFTGLLRLKPRNDKPCNKSALLDYVGFAKIQHFLKPFGLGSPSAHAAPCHKSAVSLIETLLSMSILSIVIIALIPVMTVRKDADDPNSGSSYWAKNSSNEAYISPVGNPKIIVGTQALKASDGTANPYIGDSSFYLFNTGFSNKNLPALSVAKKFDFNGQVFDTKASDAALPNDSLYIHSGSVGVFTSPNSVVVGSLLNNSLKLSSNNSTAVGIGALQDVIGVNNVAIGTDSLKSYGGNNSIGIFCGAQTSSSAPSELFIGSVAHALTDPPSPIHAFTSSTPGARNTFRLARDFNLKAAHLTAKTFYITSDKRLKTVTGEYKMGLKEVSKIQPVIFSYKNDKSNTKRVGVIAQDLQKIMPRSVVKNAQTGYYMIDENTIFYATLNAVKELKKQSDDIEKENKILEEKLVKLKELRAKKS